MNPVTRRWCKVNSRMGIKIVNQYVSQQHGGTTFQEIKFSFKVTNQADKINSIIKKSDAGPRLWWEGDNWEFINSDIIENDGSGGGKIRVTMRVPVSIPFHDDADEVPADADDWHYQIYIRRSFNGIFHMDPRNGMLGDIDPYLDFDPPQQPFVENREDLFEDTLEGNEDKRLWEESGIQALGIEDIIIEHE